MPLLNELAQTYLTACDVEGKARSTIRGYRESLTRLQEVGARLEFPAEVEAFTVQHVYAFLGALRERGASRAYQHRLHREVKAFFSWCKRFDVITENVFARVPLVKLEQQIVQPFSTDDVRRLLAAIHRGVRAGTRNSHWYCSCSTRASAHRNACRCGSTMSTGNAGMSASCTARGKNSGG